MLISLQGRNIFIPQNIIIRYENETRQKFTEDMVLYLIKCAIRSGRRMQLDLVTDQEASEFVVKEINESIKRNAIKAKLNSELVNKYETYCLTIRDGEFDTLLLEACNTTSIDEAMTKFSISEIISRLEYQLTKYMEFV